MRFQLSADPDDFDTNFEHLVDQADALTQLLLNTINYQRCSGSTTVLSEQQEAGLIYLQEDLIEKMECLRENARMVHKSEARKLEAAKLERTPAKKAN